jgi:hypothetical protein
VIRGESEFQTAAPSETAASIGVAEFPEGNLAEFDHTRDAREAHI